MKKIFLAAVAFFTAFTVIQAQDNRENNHLEAVLQSYYNIKDALVAGNNKSASEGATAFIKNLNGVSETGFCPAAPKARGETTSRATQSINLEIGVGLFIFLNLTDQGEWYCGNFMPNHQHLEGMIRA